MPIEFRCSQCQQMLGTPDDSAGQDARCPQCGAITVVPAESIVLPESAAESAPRVPPPPPRNNSDNPYAASSAPGAEYAPARLDSAPSGLALSSLIVGIFSLLFSLPCGCLWFITVPLGLIAVVLGVVALQQCNRGEASGRGMAIAGIICGSIGMVISLLILLFFGFASMMGEMNFN